MTPGVEMLMWAPPLGFLLGVALGGVRHVLLSLLGTDDHETRGEVILL